MGGPEGGPWPRGPSYMVDYPMYPAWNGGTRITNATNNALTIYDEFTTTDDQIGLIWFNHELHHKMPLEPRVESAKGARGKKARVAWPAQRARLHSSRRQRWYGLLRRAHRGGGNHAMQLQLIPGRTHGWGRQQLAIRDAHGQECRRRVLWRRGARSVEARQLCGGGLAARHAGNVPKVMCDRFSSDGGMPRT